MKPGELKVLTEEQKEGIKKADAVRAALVRAVNEEHSKRPYPKRKNNK